jgi:hypothetical protein
MIFASIAWYALLLFLVGIKGGYEIVAMARALSAEHNDDDQATARRRTDGG